jgi:tetratricopeptide (TPR) repeat protein
VGDYRRAIDYLRQMVTARAGARSHEQFGHVNLPAVVARVILAQCHAELGMFAEGSSLGEAGLRIAETVGHPGSLMWAYSGIGVLALRQGDLPRALLRLEQALHICQDTGFPVYFPYMATVLGAAYTLGGHVTDAVPLLTQALAQTKAMGTGGFQVHCSLSLGEAQMWAGHLEEAHALAEQALTHARARQERGNEAYTLCLLGDIAARREPPQVVQAEDHYCQALTRAEALGMRPLQAHCHRGLGTLYARAGQREQARTALFTAIDLYRAMDMTFWLPQTAAARAQVEGC